MCPIMGPPLCLAVAWLNQTSGDSYTGSTVPELSSVRHAHGNRRAAVQACTQRTLRRLCTNVMWFDLATGSMQQASAGRLTLDANGSSLVLPRQGRGPESVY